MIGPSFAPSPSPHGRSYLDADIIVSSTISLADRLVICSICFYRLYQYHRIGLLDWSELKVKFHIFMLLTVQLNLPFFIYCASHDEIQTCYEDPGVTNKSIYQTTYAIYRIGLSFQLVCLSLTAFQWQDFLCYSGTHRLSAQDALQMYRLKLFLLAVNLLSILSSLVINGIIIIDPTAVDDNHSSLIDFFVSANWLTLDIIQLALAAFLAIQGSQMSLRIKGSSAIDAASRSRGLSTLQTTLTIIIFCLTVEFITRILGALPEFYNTFHPGKDFDETTGSSHAIYSWISAHPIFWELTTYILPYDIVSFCLLYLMRAPLKKRSDFNTNESARGPEEYSMDTVDGGDGSGGAPQRHRLLSHEALNALLLSDDELAFGEPRDTEAGGDFGFRSESRERDSGTNGSLASINLSETGSSGKD
mmetsp:Transcript_68262/g.154445  ORF Transcript_68262/g.154445 Transcript_68262/m.154445 type:complete len:418 (+) Transcript_68262:103-1356(+)